MQNSNIQNYYNILKVRDKKQRN